VNTDIRPIATREEIDRCARLMATTDPWVTLGRDEAHARRVLANRNLERYVIRVDGALAGFLVLDLQGSFVGYIKSVCVAPEFRGRGVGTTLIHFAEDRIFRDHPNVFMLVSSFNRDARRLYERLGYEAVGELRDFVVEGHSEILLRKTTGPLNPRP
jgi:[ribosomal protein S18]-alanine N-acetyltransferase